MIDREEAARRMSRIRTLLEVAVDLIAQAHREAEDVSGPTVTRIVRDAFDAAEKARNWIR